MHGVFCSCSIVDEIQHGGILDSHMHFSIGGEWMVCFLVAIVWLLCDFCAYYRVFLLQRGIRVFVAIKTAVMLAEPGDIILLAGKGHECYQIIGDEQLPFSDKEEVTKWFENFKR